MTVPTLPLNGSVVLTVTGTAPSVNTSFTNMAQAHPPLTVTDPNLANNVGGPVTTGVLAVADLAIAKSDGVGTVDARWQYDLHHHGHQQWPQRSH